MTGADLKAWRDKLLWSKSRAAIKLGITRGYLREMEADIRPVPEYIALATWELWRRAHSDPDETPLA